MTVCICPGSRCECSVGDDVIREEMERLSEVCKICGEQRQWHVDDEFCTPGDASQPIPGDDEQPILRGA